MKVTKVGRKAIRVEIEPSDGEYTDWQDVCAGLGAGLSGMHTAVEYERNAAKAFVDALYKMIEEAR